MNKILNILRAVRLTVKAFKSIYKSGGYLKAVIKTSNDTEKLKNKNILITGGGSGIGLAIAEKCLREGANVVITGRNKQKLELALGKLNNSNLHTLQWDISDVTIVTKKIEECHILLNNHIDILVNNAGVLAPNTFGNVSPQEWDEVYSIKSKGVFFLTQEVCKTWIKKPNGIRKILNISSTSAFVGADSPYRMSKWDIVGLTEGLGYNLANKGILINGIAPGRTATEMLGKNTQDNVFDSTVPLKRLALPEEIAELAIFLMSDIANFITGQTIICDGGRTLKN